MYQKVPVGGARLSGRGQGIDPGTDQIQAYKLKIWQFI
jgi:hypothetical protein